jgi:hypothetical protein
MRCDDRDRFRAVDHRAAAHRDDTVAFVRVIGRYGARDAVIGRVFRDFVGHGEIVGAVHCALHGGEDARLNEALIGDEERPLDTKRFEFGLQ